MLVVLGVYGLLVTTHDGEFWPFSIYQMFSSAGRPWTRVMVREVPSVLPETIRWMPEDMMDLSGRPFAMHENGVPQNDVAAYVAQTVQWTKARGEGLQAMLGYERASERILAVYRMLLALPGAKIWDRLDPSSRATIRSKKYASGSRFVPARLCAAGRRRR